MKYFKYLKYLLKHIWYVRIACWRHGLFWQGLVHDASKFRLDEFLAYANFFYGKKPFKRDTTGFYSPAIVEDKKFLMAWFLHQKRNPHHWQYWVMPHDDGSPLAMPMPHRYRLEMLCDWWGASMAQGFKGKCRTWYLVNQDKMLLHPETRAWVDANVSDRFV